MAKRTGCDDAGELMKMTLGGMRINQANNKAPDGLPPYSPWPIKPSDHPFRDSAIMEPALKLRGPGIYEIIKARLGIFLCNKAGQIAGVLFGGPGWFEKHTG